MVCNCCFKLLIMLFFYFHCERLLLQSFRQFYHCLVAFLPCAEFLSVAQQGGFGALLGLVSAPAYFGRQLCVFVQHVDDVGLAVVFRFRKPYVSVLILFCRYGVVDGFSVLVEPLSYFFSRSVASGCISPSGVGPTPSTRLPPLATISMSVFITFSGVFHRGRGTHPQSSLSGMQLSHG